MEQVRITRKFTFEMAHLLWQYDGACKNVHGHSYKLFVTVAGRPLCQKGHPKDGMVMDFKKLKALVREQITSHFDHALALSADVPVKVAEALRPVSPRIVTLPFQPTSENLVLHFVDILKQHLPAGVTLLTVELFETENAAAAWHASDNVNG